MRNTDELRVLLMLLSKDNDRIAIEENIDNKTIMYAKEEGLIDAVLIKAWGGSYVLVDVQGLTHKGRELLKQMEDKHIYQRAKRLIGSSINTVTLPVLMQVLSKAASQLIEEL